MKYGEYKARIRIRGKSGDSKHEFTTWIGSLITRILEATTIGHCFSSNMKDTVVIEIVPGNREFETLTDENREE